MDHNFSNACYLPSIGSPLAVQTLDSHRKASCSSKVPPHKAVDSSPRRRQDSRGKRIKPVISPLADYSKRLLVLHENTGYESTDGKKEQNIRSCSYNPFELDFPEIKWVEDENENNKFPFRMTKTWTMMKAWTMMKIGTMTNELTMMKNWVYEDEE
jgi:hypothetical protein